MGGFGRVDFSEDNACLVEVLRCCCNDADIHALFSSSALIKNVIIRIQN